MSERSTEKRLENAKRRGLLVVYTGEGKGKTTASLGAVFRALGRGYKVGVVQFIKGKWKTGEAKFAEKQENLDFAAMGEGFTWESDNLEVDKAAARKAWDKVDEMVRSDRYELIVLDELTYCVHYNFLDIDTILGTLSHRPERLHVIVTGRDADPKLIDAADIVTEMRKVKHSFDQGVPAQLGLDY
ncbi:cob(I)yrinic acid a,c-diamide adenosyltransferase [bacterium]|nr:cob(I)yrinic acid a,c-diamide adenosyltransferase [bacterium]